MKVWIARLGLLALAVVMAGAPVSRNVWNMITKHHSAFEIPRETSIWTYKHHGDYGEDAINYYHRLEPGKIWFFTKENAAKVPGFDPSKFSTWPEQLCNSK